MRLKGISNKGFSRIAQSREDKTSFPGMEDVRHPPSEEERGGLPIPLKVTKTVNNNETGDSWDLEEFAGSGVDLDAVVGEPQMSVGELMQYVNEEYGIYIQEDLENPDSPDMDDVVDAIKENNLGFSGNTYNDSWWGPTLEFSVLGPAEDDPYGSGVLILSEHLGGDVRGNYASWKAYYVNYYAENAPWYTCRMYWYIETDQGEISMDSEDAEGYHFIINEDETGTWENGDDVDYDEIKEKLNWEDSEIHDPWW